METAKKCVQRNERMEKFRKMQISSYSVVMLVLSLLLHIYEHNKNVTGLVGVFSLY